MMFDLPMKTLDWSRTKRRRHTIFFLKASSGESMTLICTSCCGYEDSYDREVFSTKTNLLMNHIIDMAVQGYGGLAA